MQDEEITRKSKNYEKKEPWTLLQEQQERGLQSHSEA